MASYPVRNTIWPTAVPIDPKIQELVGHFYVLADLQDPRAGERFASEIFTPTGIIEGAGGVQKFQGEAELRKCREQAWDAISSRHHEIRRAFVADSNGFDLMVIGVVTMEVRKHGKTIKGEFVARLVVDPESAEAGNPRLASSTVWADRAPFLAALKE